jgi:DNA-binding CsgD family transcriptional regulator
MRDATFRELTSAIAGFKTGGYEHVIEQAAVALSVTLDCACVIALLSGDGDRLYPIGLHHPAPEAAELVDEIAATSFPANDGYTGQAIRSGARVLIDHVTPEELRDARSPFATIAERFGAGAILAVPLLGRSAPLGAIACATSSRQPFSGEDQAFVSDVAAVVAMAVESALLAEGGDGQPGGVRIPLPLEAGSSSPPPAPGSSAGLTPRESEILAQLARGYTNKEIADRLVLSVRTVEWHRARLQWKLRVSTRAELITAARALGVLDD